MAARRSLCPVVAPLARAPPGRPLTPRCYASRRRSGPPPRRFRGVAVYYRLEPHPFHFMLRNIFEFHFYFRELALIGRVWKMEDERGRCEPGRFAAMVPTDSQTRVQPVAAPLIYLYKL